MRFSLKRAEGVKRVSNPVEDDIPQIASYRLSEGKPLELLLIVDEPIFQEKKKEGLEPVLRQYGEILANYPFSHGISIRLPNLEKTEEIVRDYKAGKLKGIVGMELSYADAVMCNKYKPIRSYGA